MTIYPPSVLPVDKALVDWRSVDLALVGLASDLASADRLHQDKKHHNKDHIQFPVPPGKSEQNSAGSRKHLEDIFPELDFP